MSRGTPGRRVVPLSAYAAQSGEDVPFSVLQSEAAGEVVVVVGGVLDVATAPRLTALLASVPAGSRVVVDVRAVDLLCAAGLNVLAAAERRQAASGGEVRVRGARPLAAQCLAVTGLGHLVEPAQPPGQPG